MITNVASAKGFTRAPDFRTILNQSLELRPLMFLFAEPFTVRNTKVKTPVKHAMNGTHTHLPSKDGNFICVPNEMKLDHCKVYEPLASKFHCHSCSSNDYHLASDVYNNDVKSCHVHACQTYSESGFCLSCLTADQELVNSDGDHSQSQKICIPKSKVVKHCISYSKDGICVKCDQQTDPTTGFRFTLFDEDVSIGLKKAVCTTLECTSFTPSGWCSACKDNFKLVNMGNRNLLGIASLNDKMRMCVENTIVSVLPQCASFVQVRGRYECGLCKADYFLGFSLEDKFNVCHLN